MIRSTLSRHHSQFPHCFPDEIKRGYGCHVLARTDPEYRNSRWFIDWMWSGTGILGHAHHKVVEAVARQLGSGFAFGLCHPLEQEVGTMLCEVLPDYAEDCRFASNGTDSVAGAVRLARAVTGRKGIIIFKGSYHGASTGDWFAETQEPARGILKHFVTYRCNWNDSRGLREAMRTYRPAAVVFEVGEKTTPEFIQALNDVHSYGALLIADEVVTGFRLALGGACELYGIHPDLACFGKALGSGVPVSALVGKREFMREFDLDYTNEPVFMSFTHSGNALGLAAAKATIKAIQEENAIERIWASGKQLIARFLSLSSGLDLEIIGQSPRHSIRFKDSSITGQEMFWILQQAACEMGVLLGVTNCANIYHGTQVVEQTAEAMYRGVQRIRKAIERGSVEGILKGGRPRKPYSVRKA